MTCKCGSNNVTVISKEKRKRNAMWWLLIGWWLVPLVGIFAFLGKSKKIKWYNRCLDCGREWKC